MKKSLSVLILAAGKGTRMRSARPKVLHSVGGLPMVERVIQAVLPLRPNEICLIIGHGAGAVKDTIHVKYPKIKFVIQKKLDGSGGAVRQARSWINRQRGTVLITCGDMPLLQTETLRNLSKRQTGRGPAAAVLTADVPDPFGYGRIIRNPDGTVSRIVEELDATPLERKINEINTGTYLFDARLLSQNISKIKNNNKKREYYLTDLVDLVGRVGGRVQGIKCADYRDAAGINSRAQLAEAEAVVRTRTLLRLMAEGVTILDPASTFVDENVRIGPDTVIWPQSFILAGSRIGSGCQIGPWAHIVNTEIENNVVFRSSFADSSRIRQNSKIGPYSHIRPGSDLGPNAHMGNFSETKKSRLGPGSKLNHLSYLGDAKVGKNVNIGAGTITCNYDGFRKSPTLIGDHAFIGSNTNLIAPIRVGAFSIVGAGSSLSKDVPAGALVFERAPRTEKKGWARRFIANKGRKP